MPLSEEIPGIVPARLTENRDPSPILGSPPLCTRRVTWHLLRYRRVQSEIHSNAPLCRSQKGRGCGGFRLASFVRASRSWAARTYNDNFHSMGLTAAPQLRLSKEPTRGELLSDLDDPHHDLAAAELFNMITGMRTRMFILPPLTDAARLCTAAAPQAEQFNYIMM